MNKKKEKNTKDAYKELYNRVYPCSCPKELEKAKEVLDGCLEAGYSHEQIAWAYDYVCRYKEPAVQKWVDSDGVLHEYDPHWEFNLALMTEKQMEDLENG